MKSDEICGAFSGKAEVLNEVMQDRLLRSKWQEIIPVCIDKGVEIKLYTKYHWQISPLEKGKYTINYYPTKGRVYIVGTHKSFSEKNPERIVNYVFHYPEDRVTKAAGRKFNRKVREKFFIKQEGICAICEEPMYLHEATVDHIIPFSKGGADRMDNKQVVHEKCNQEKADKV